MYTTQLSNQFITDALGGTFNWLLSFKLIQEFMLAYIHPWVSCLTFILNVVVFLLCIAIYSKTKKQNHKPAFLYIGVMAFFDMVVGAFNIYDFTTLRVTDEEFEIQEKCISGWPVFVFMQWSSWNTLAVLTIDRYIFIKKPLHYPLIMTPCRSLLLLFSGLLVALLLAILAGFTIRLPPDNISIQLCTWVHVFPGWLQFVLVGSYLSVLIIQLTVYSEILAKFRQSRKQLEALQNSSTGEDFAKSNLKFEQTRGIFKKKFKPIPENKNIHPISFKTVEYPRELNFTQEYQQRKRRPSSIVRQITVLASHVRAARYILILVVTLFITTMPMHVFETYDVTSHMVQTNAVGIPTNNTVNGTSLFICLKTSLQNQHCSMDIEIEHTELYEYEERIRQIAHVEISAYLEYFFGVMMTLLNAMFNPLLYAFWYPEFWTYLAQIPDWFKKKKENPDDFKFELKIVKI